jgi:hypothetical protein
MHDWRVPLALRLTQSLPALAGQPLSESASVQGRRRPLAQHAVAEAGSGSSMLRVSESERAVRPWNGLRLLPRLHAAPPATPATLTHAPTHTTRATLEYTHLRSASAIPAPYHLHPPRIAGLVPLQGIEGPAGAAKGVAGSGRAAPVGPAGRAGPAVRLGHRAADAQPQRAGRQHRRAAGGGRG